MLFRVNVSSGELSKIAVDASALLFGDGLLRVGRHLYVARNAVNEIANLTLADGWHSATVGSELTNPGFAFPTALARLRGRLLITNAQLNAPTSPKLPFTVLDLPFAAASRNR